MVRTGRKAHTFRGERQPGTGTRYHQGVTDITQWAACHPDSMTSAGNIKVDASGHSTQLDGVVEALPWP
jgi:hypothetical protein